MKTIGKGKCPKCKVKRMIVARGKDQQSQCNICYYPYGLDWELE